MNEELKIKLGINEWLKLIKEDKNLNGAFISICQYIYLTEKENQELKKQLEEHKNKYIKRFEKLLAEGIEPDSEDFYLAEIEGKANDYDKLLNQQKKFIKWLEDEIILCKNKPAYTVTDIFGSYDLNKIELEFFEKVVKKYKEIIGEGR